MRDQIKLRKKSGVEMTFTKETQAEKRSGNPQHQIKIATEFLAETNDHCPFFHCVHPLRGHDNY